MTSLSELSEETLVGEKYLHKAWDNYINVRCWSEEWWIVNNKGGMNLWRRCEKRTNDFL
jgi:hypothetical protein